MSADPTKLPLTEAQKKANQELASALRRTMMDTFADLPLPYQTISYAVDRAVVHVVKALHEREQSEGAVEGPHLAGRLRNRARMADPHTGTVEVSAAILLEAAAALDRKEQAFCLPTRDEMIERIENRIGEIDPRRIADIPDRNLAEILVDAALNGADCPCRCHEHFESPRVGCANDEEWDGNLVDASQFIREWED